MADLVQQLQSLPAEVNPYFFLRSFVWRALSPDAEDWFFYNMWINLALLGICLLAALYALYARYKAKTLWFFRMRDSSTGKVLLPNTTGLFSLFSAMFCPLAIMNIAVLIEGTRKMDYSPVIQMACYIFVWPPLMCAMWAECHGMAVALYVAYPNTRILGIPINAMALNIFFIIGYPLSPVLDIPYFAKAATTFRKAWNTYTVLSAELQPSIESWQPGQVFAAQDAWLALLQTFTNNMNSTFNSVKHAFYFHLTGHLIIMVVFCPIGVLYMYIVKRQINRSSHSHSFVNSRGSADGRLDTLRKSFAIMIFEVAAVLISTVAYSALCLWISADPQSTLGGETERAVVFVLVFYLWSVFATPVNVIITYRLFKRKDQAISSSHRRIFEDDQKAPFQPLSLCAAIKVETEVAIEVDRQDVELGSRKLKVAVLRPFADEKMDEKDKMDELF